MERVEFANPLRFSLSVRESGDIEIFSCVTRTELVLPECDRESLIHMLATLHQGSSARETVFLDLPS